MQVAQQYGERADILLIGVATDPWHRELLDWQTSTPLDTASADQPDYQGKVGSEARVYPTTIVGRQSH